MNPEPSSDMHRSTITAAALAGVALWAAGCGLFGPDEWADRQAELDANRAVWEEAGIESYRFELRRQCYCALAGEFRITVESSTVVLVERPDGGPLPIQENRFLETVDDLFVVIQDAIDERAFRYDVEYDAELGYPTVVDLDPIRNAIDEEVRYEAGGLIALDDPQG